MNKKPVINITNFTMKYDFDCGPTSVAILLSAYNMDFTPDKLIEIFKTNEDGTSWRRMKNFLRKLNTFRIEEYFSINKANDLLEKNIPLLICWDVKTEGEVISHYSVIAAMNDKKVTILDPEDRAFFTSFKLNEFKDCWRPYRYWSVRLIPNKVTGSKRNTAKDRAFESTENLQNDAGVLNVSKVKSWIS